MKKALCVVLTVCMLFTLCPWAAFAADAPAQNPYPLVIVRGMDFTNGLRMNAGTPEEQTVNLLNALDVSALLKALTGAFGALITKGRSAAVAEITGYAYTLFGAYACDENGDSLDPAVSSPSYPLAVSHYPEIWEAAEDSEEGLVRAAAERYGAENVYYFIYDWRMDALENAAALNEMIAAAMADHACNKVDLVCCSMGGIVTLTYLNYYGAAHVDTLVSVSATMYGTDVTTDLLQGRVDFNAEAVTRYLRLHLPKAEGAVNLLYKVKLISLVCGLLNRFAANYKTEIYRDVLTPVFGTMPAVWELVQPEEYEACKAFIFGDSADAYAGLLAKTDKIQREVVQRRQQILDGAQAGGMKLAVLAGYNTPNVPAYSSAALQGDGTLETRCTSMGALVSEVGGTLTAEQLAAGDAKYVSPDRCINASACMYPEQTWFVKDGGHISTTYGSDYNALVFALLEAAAQPTVRTWAAYPQFMQADGLKLAPATDAPGRWDR